MNKFTESHTAANECSSTHVVRLEYDHVFRLLDSLENLSRNSSQDAELEQLREDLDDACWLAQWKREYVVMDEARLALIASSMS